MGRDKQALIIGASRNLGLGIATELLNRDWDVTGTVRGTRRTGLHDLADTAEDGRLTIEHADINAPDDLIALRDRLAGQRFDLLFVNAGITDPDLPVGEVATEVFTQVMITNALSPLRTIETLQTCVSPTGTIGVMSSRQGSIGFNTRGGHEVYRASKSALNQLMRSYAVRAGGQRTLLLIHPGWVQTELGGEGAPLSVAESSAGVVDTILAHAGEQGLQFRDYQDNVVSW